MQTYGAYALPIYPVALVSVGASSKGNNAVYSYSKAFLPEFHFLNFISKTHLYFLIPS
jgi:hypothetical protein